MRELQSMMNSQDHTQSTSNDALIEAELSRPQIFSEKSKTWQ
jgi:hypothetical protein